MKLSEKVAGEAREKAILVKIWPPKAKLWKQPKAGLLALKE
jgi:hypothetical protein